MKVLVTGGKGFIGSAVARNLIATTDHSVVVLDAMTYAATEGSVADAVSSTRFSFVRADICNAEAVHGAMKDHAPDAVVHLAAESHVDRSIDGPAQFVHTNLVGTANLLEAARHQGIERFVHVSTDEVFGSLSMTEPAFTESTPYNPRSPYSASKAGSDHLVRAWGETFDLPVLITNCSNNYGPYQFPEKLIPLIVIRSMTGEPLPVYGRGENVRDWLFVEDHAAALVKVLEQGVAGETYNVGGNEERTNLAVVETLCDLVDDIAGHLPNVTSRRSLIEFVADRPGHDLRYAINSTKIESALGWKPTVSFEEGLRQTVTWYLNNQTWWQPLINADASVRRGLSGMN